ncbi:hypothetical protein [Aureibaculum luteum]|uniref:hypothetical protein n=1 Tax=Aureibaculum luteum TaxID=1548456 RepID=UPI000E49B1ED|nr:hypothetical protein [Aureibaculum luteum]
MSKPEFPLISVYKKSGIDILQSESTWQKATVLAVLNGNKNSIAFDKNGQKWNYGFKSDKVNDTFITRFLAKTVYNPIVDIKIDYNLLEKYTQQELKEEIYQCVDSDDDILTQFVESDFLKKQISESNSFESILEKLDKYIFNVNENELFK